MSSRTTKPISRIAIIGVGQVGGAAAYALILGSVASELLLVDIKVDRRNAQVRDLSDVAYSSNSGTRVRAATHQEARDSDIVVITAGSKYSLGETSIRYMDRNVGIMRSIVNAMKPFRSDTVLLVVANPVDLLTTIAVELSGLPHSQVLGSGTFLDSVRLRGLLADKAGVAASSIDLFTIGVQGEYQYTPFSTVTIGGIPLDQSLPPHAANLSELQKECDHQYQSIIKAKGSTPFGIGSVVSSICSSVLLDKRNVRPISHFHPGFGCCFSMPVVLGREGIVRTIKMPMDHDEDDALGDTLNGVREQIMRVHENRQA